MKKYRHKKLGIVGEVKSDNHLHYQLVAGDMVSHETIPMIFVKDSNDWEELSFKCLSVFREEDGQIMTYDKDVHGFDFRKVRLISVENEAGLKLKIGDVVSNPAGRMFIITWFYLDSTGHNMLCNGDFTGDGHVNINKVTLVDRQVF